MHRSRFRTGACRHLFIVALLAAIGSGCSSLVGADQQPREALIEVTGTSPVPLRLVTSQNFTAQLNAETGDYDVDLITFSEEDLPVPVSLAVTLNRDRLFVRLTNIDADAEADIHLRVLFDGSLAYSQAATLRDASLEFIHVFF